MDKYIKKLQSKKEETRKLIFTGTLFVAMSFVVMIWVSGIGTRFVNPEIKEQARADIKPFKLFSDSISSTYKSMSASVGEITNKKEVIVNEGNEGNEINLIPVEYSN